MRYSGRISRFLAIVLVVVIVVAAGEWYALRGARAAFEEMLFRDGLDAASVLIEACRTVYEFQVLREIERESMLVYASASVPSEVTGEALERIATEAHLPLAILTDEDGNITAKSGGLYSGLYPWITRLPEHFPMLYSGLVERELFGIDRELPLTEGPKGLALRVDNGILILFAPEPTIQEREQLTVGRLIGRLGENPGVRYLALQDESGFIFGTKSVGTMTSLTVDTFLVEVLESREPAWRYADFSGEKVFELAVRFPSMGRYRGVLRTGLSTTEHDRLLSGYALQLGLIMILVLAVAIAAAGLLLTTRRLTEEKNLSGAVLSEMNSACVAVDKKGSITLINPLAARLFRLRQSVIGQDSVEAFDGDPLRLRETLSTGSGRAARVEFDSSGTRRLLDVSTGTLPGGGAFSIAEDITDLVELRKEAAGAEHLRTLGELAAGVAHEIRNPLNTIGIAAQRLSAEFEPKSDPEGYNELLTGLRAEITRLDQIVREFIGLSAPIAPNLELQPAGPIIEEIVEAAKLGISGSGIEFIPDISETGSVSCDAEMLKKALLNLIKNAVEATPNGGRIELRTRLENEYLAISIWDNGPPIPEAIRDKLGKPFVSAGKEGGTGIGLFVVYRTIRDHGGKINVESDESGTKFTVKLPLIRP